MLFSNDALDWDRDGGQWPNCEFSRFVMADRVRFHVQVAGKGPVLLLLHGTGASTHSWRNVFPLLRDRFTVIAPDLPGHGFSSMAALETVSLGGYAHLLGALMRELGLTPSLVAGHSAGAAIAVEMAIAGEAEPGGIVSFNGAFVPMGGAGDQFFQPLARMLSLNPLMPKLFAWRAGSLRVVKGLIEGTGSHLDGEGLNYYQTLMTSPAHCSAALQMMARWDLHDLVERMVDGLRCPLLLVTGDRDKAIAPDDARAIDSRLPDAEHVEMADAGHLAHEEHPGQAARIITGAWDRWSGRPAEPRQRRIPEGLAC